MRPLVLVEHVVADARVGGHEARLVRVRVTVTVRARTRASAKARVRARRPLRQRGNECGSGVVMVTVVVC